jgi:DNA-binding transcriptional ArsR family regulator
MRSEPPPLLPILRSHHQAQLLADILLHPDEETSLTDLARRLDMAVSTVHLEVGRLIDAGILSDRQVGRSRLVRANRDGRLFAVLSQLMLLTYGPAVVIAEEFRDVGATAEVAIFGSWAARYAGTIGAAPNDIDVLVVGDKVSRLAVDAAAQRSEDRLRIQVNPVAMTQARWHGSKDPLAAQIQAGPTFSITDRLEIDKRNSA